MCVCVYMFKYIHVFIHALCVHTNIHTRIIHIYRCTTYMHANTYIHTYNVHNAYRCTTYIRALLYLTGSIVRVMVSVRAIKSVDGGLGHTIVYSGIYG